MTALHNPARAAQHAAWLASRRRMTAKKYSPRDLVVAPEPEPSPPPPPANPEPAPAIEAAPTVALFEPIEIEDNPVLRVLAERQKIRAIIKETATYFGLPFNELVSNRRTGDVILPRHIAMWLCIKFKHFSYPEIGRRFGRDHSTVIHAVRKIDARIAAGDAKVIEAVDTIVATLGLAHEQG